MSDETKIQWCDSTVNPIMGCAGCELFPSPATVIKAIDQAVGENVGEKFSSRPVFKKLIEECFEDIPDDAEGFQRRATTTNIWHLREPFYEKIKEKYGLENVKVAEHALEQQVTCYAGKLHLNRGTNIARPQRESKKGYATTFEILKRYPGRVEEMAAKRDLLGQANPKTPWKDRLPRMIFVSDMGDALSKKGDFAFLKEDVMKPICSESGQSHLWLWLTKRPGLMSDFTDDYGPFPDNVCAMTTVTGPDRLERIDQLRAVNAKIRGLSIEPLWERIPPSELNLDGIDWVIVGGESGKYEHVREFKLEWVEELRAHCKAQGVAFFLKQFGRRPTWGGEAMPLTDTHGGDWEEWPEQFRIREFPQEFHDYRKDEMVQKRELRPFPKKTKVRDIAGKNFTKEERKEFKQLDRKVRKGVVAFFEAGEALLKIHEQKLWKVSGHSTWEDYCREVAGFSRIHAHRLMKGAKTALMLREMLPTGNNPDAPLPQSESQVRHLVKLDTPDQQVKAWTSAAEKSGGNPTERDVKKAVFEILQPDDPRETKTTPAERRTRLVKTLREAVAEHSWERVEKALEALEKEIL